MCHRLKIYLVFLCCFLPTFLVTSAEKPLTASVPSFAPFYFANTGEKCKGIAVNALKKVTGQLAVKVVPLPYARIIRSLEIGQLDLALIFKSNAITESVQYIGPVSQSKVVILTSINTPISEYSELRDLTAIAVIRNAQFEERFDQDESLTKVYVESYHQGIKLFKLGRVDGVVGSLVGLDYELRSNNLDVAILKQAFQLGIKEWWLHLSNKSSTPSLLSQLTSIVKKNYQPDLIFKTYLEHTKYCQTKS